MTVVDLITISTTRCGDSDATPCPMQKQVPIDDGNLVNNIHATSIENAIWFP
jgi:hypothetical protein